MNGATSRHPKTEEEQAHINGSIEENHWFQQQIKLDQSRNRELWLLHFQ